MADIMSSDPLIANGISIRESDVVLKFVALVVMWSVSVDSMLELVSFSFAEKMFSDWCERTGLDMSGATHDPRPKKKATPPK